LARVSRRPPSPAAAALFDMAYEDRHLTLSVPVESTCLPSVNLGRRRKIERLLNTSVRGIRSRSCSPDPLTSTATAATAKFHGRHVGDHRVAAIRCYDPEVKLLKYYFCLS
jgi:hypothetical protein